MEFAGRLLQVATLDSGSVKLSIMFNLGVVAARGRLSVCAELAQTGATLLVVERVARARASLLPVHLRGVCPAAGFPWCRALRNVTESQNIRVGRDPRGSLSPRSPEDHLKDVICLDVFAKSPGCCRVRLSGGGRGVCLGISACLQRAAAVDRGPAGAPCPH